MRTTDRLAFLDALRGLAALYVVLFHVMAMPSPAVSAGPVLTPILAAGGTGVALFFVISAFSLCYTMPRHAATGRPILSFYLHRVFRIAPLFYCWLAFSLYRDGRGAHVGHAAAEVAANVSFTFNLVQGWQQGIVWASWAIGVEMLFYALFPLLLGAIRGLPGALLLAAALTGAAMLASSGLLGEQAKAWTGDYGLLRHAPVFAFGLCAFFAYERLTALDGERARRWGIALGVAGLLGLAAAVALLSRAIAPAIGWIACGLMYALLLLGMSQCAPRFVVNPISTSLGKISYSLYLGHPAIIAILAPLFGHVRQATSVPALAYATCALATLAVALPLAWLTYRLIEVPGIALGKRLGPQRRPADPASLQAAER
ncbi:acyltransferase [Xanthomonas protegens]|uniref:Acyltransferase n=1 Tax=Xanthomonas protegens TaxID=3380705 RepID=A0ABU9LF22_9XANT